MRLPHSSSRFRGVRGGVQVPADGSVFGFGSPGTATIDFSASNIFLAASSAYAIVFSSVAYGLGDEVNGNYGLYAQGGFSETYAGGSAYRYLEYNPLTQTPVGSIQSGFGDLAFTVTAVPEPSTWTLAGGLAALALGWWRRRDRSV